MVALPKTDVSFGVSSLVAPAKTLATALAALARVSDQRSSIPILAHAMVRGGLLVATDLNVTLTIRAPLEWGAGFTGICVNAKALADIARKLPGSTISLGRTGTTALKVASESSDTTLLGISDREFPKVPSSEGLPFTICDGARLKSMIERVLFAVCRDETRFHLNGVLFESEGSTANGTARMVATDGHRLTRVDDRIATDGLWIPSRGVIIPAKAAKEIAKLLKAADCHVAIKDHLLFVKQGDWEIAAKLIDAQFPPYDQVIPKDHSKLATVERKLLLAALKRAKPLTLATRGVKFTLASGKLTLTSDHPDLGTASESLKAESEWMDLDNHGFEIGFNPAYLIDALDEIDCKHVTFAFGKELDPVLVRGTEDAVSYSVAGSQQLCVIMPMCI